IPQTICRGAPSIGDQSRPLSSDDAGGFKKPEMLFAVHAGRRHFELQPRRTESVLDQSLQCLYGGSDSVALSGGVDSRHQHFTGLVGARALGCEATHGGRRETLARRYRTSYLEAYLER